MTQPLNNQIRPFEIGFYNFVDSGTNPLTGEKKDPAVVMKNMLEVIELADQVAFLQCKVSRPGVDRLPEGRAFADHRLDRRHRPRHRPRRHVLRLRDLPRL